MPVISVGTRIHCAKDAQAAICFRNRLCLKCIAISDMYQMSFQHYITFKNKLFSFKTKPADMIKYIYEWENNKQNHYNDFKKLNRKFYTIQLCLSFVPKEIITIVIFHVFPPEITSCLHTAWLINIFHQ